MMKKANLMLNEETVVFTLDSCPEGQKRKVGWGFSVFP